MADVHLSQKERDELVERHLDWVRKLALQIKRSSGVEIDLEELVAYGSRGLVEAASRYDPSRGAAFTTFSYYRIRGAIFDGLREIGWLNRSEYARFQAHSNELLGNMADRDAAGAGREESSAAVVSDVAGALDQIAVVFITSLDAGHSEPEDSEQLDGDELLERKRASERVRAALEKLPARERRLIDLYYYKGWTLQAVGKELGGFSKSWTSRLHARAIAMLQDALESKR